MKINLFLAIVSSLTILISCKHEKSVDELPLQRTGLNDNFLKVKLDVLVKHDDNFCIFYTTDGSTDFTKIEPIWKDVKGSDDYQNIVYELPEEIKPTQLRLDFGIHKDQPDIVFRKITLTYKDKIEEIGLPALGNFFRQDDSKCTFDSKDGIIKAVFVSGERKFPSLYPREENLGPLIQKLYK